MTSNELKWLQMASNSLLGLKWPQLASLASNGLFLSNKCDFLGNFHFSTNVTQRRDVLCIRNCAENSCWGKLIGAPALWGERITVLFTDHMECEYYHNNWIITIGMLSPWNYSLILNAFIVMVSITISIQNSFELIFGRAPSFFA